MTIQTPLDTFQTRIGEARDNRPARRPRKRALAFAGLGAALLAGLGWHFLGGNSAEAAPPPVPVVTIASPIGCDMLLIFGILVVIIISIIITPP